MATPNIIYRRPKFDLRFVTENTKYHVKYDTQRPSNKNMNENIISIHSKNALDNDTAAFTIVLAGDREWDKILYENDMVIMNIEPNEYNPQNPYKKDKPRGKTVILGLITEVRIEGGYGDNTKMYRITGQSFQKAFSNFELRSIQQAGQVTGEVGWMNWVTDNKDGGMNQLLVGETVTKVVRELIKRFKKYMEYDFVQGEEISNYKDFLENRVIYSINTWEMDEFLRNPIPITSFEGTFNQLIQEVAGAPFNEYFFETFNAPDGYEKVKMVVRRTPFDKKDWQKLDTNVLRSREVLEENFGRSDMEAYTIYNVIPSTVEEGLGIMTSVPWYSDKLVGKYGYKMMEVESKFLTIPPKEDWKEGAGDSSVEGGESYFTTTPPGRFGKKLYNWYVNNPNFYAGYITVVGHPDYRLGNRLVYVNESRNEHWEFYIESVEHTFTYEEGYTTRLGVTRGLRVSGLNDHGIRFNPPAGEAKRFRGGYLGEINFEEIEKMEKAKEAKKENARNAANNSDVVVSGNFMKPTEGVITSEYGMRMHPIRKEYRMHAGIDIAKAGAKVVAAEGGIVTSSRYHSTYGNVVEISHGTVNGQENVSTLYAHMTGRNVRAGDNVMRGQKLGIQGATGAVTGVHLHFEVKVGGKHVNPRKFVDF